MQRRRRRLAAVLRQLSGPPSTCLSSPSVAAPPTEQSAGPWWADPEPAAATFQRQGFLLLDNWIEGAELRRAQDAYMRAMLAERPAWEADVARSDHGENGSAPGWVAPMPKAEFRHSARYFDMPDVVLSDPIFLEIVAHPRLVPTLQAIVGDDVQCSNIQCRCYPSHSPEVAAVDGGYSAWHRDHQFSLSHVGTSLHIVVMLYFFDVRGPEDGCTVRATAPSANPHLRVPPCPLLPQAVVPYSHTWQGNPRADISGGSEYGRGSHRRSLAVGQESMMGHIPVRRTAGSALVFDTRCWHCAFPNIAGNDRHTLHLRYCPFWVKQAGTVVASAAELSRRGALDTPIKRQLMGLEDRDGTNWYDAEFALAHPRPDLR